MPTTFTLKQPLESYAISFDFSLVIGIETVVSAAITAVDQSTGVDVSATLLDPAKQSIATPIVFGWVQNGTDGSSYLISCVATCSGGSVYELQGILPVATITGTTDTTNLFAACRRWLNDEKVATYKWTTAELVDYFNYVMDEIARETDYFADPTTPIYISIPIFAGVDSYPFDSTVLEIVRAWIAGQTTEITKTRSRLRGVTHTAAAGNDIALNAGTITSVTTDFLQSGLKAGEYMQIFGATTPVNNKVVLIDAVTANLLTLNSSYSLTPDVAGPNMVIAQLQTDLPKNYMTDYRTGYITLDPAPVSNGTLLMNVLRLQSTVLTEATIPVFTIPIHYQYHLQLVDGILSKAYMKSGPSTFNIDKAKVHTSQFAILKDRIKRDMEKAAGIQRTLRPCDGAI